MQAPFGIGEDLMLNRPTLQHCARIFGAICLGFGVLFAQLWGSASAEVANGKMPRMPDPKALDTSAREVYQEVIREEFCACNSALTIQGCLERKPQCSLARHLAQLTFTKAQSQAGATEILGSLSREIMGPYCRPPAQFDLSQIPVRGPKDAAITLVVIADFRCSHCQKAHPQIEALWQKQRHRMRMAFLPFPLQDHPDGMAAAKATLAAGRQGKFWQMQDALFRHGGTQFPRSLLRKMAQAIGLKLAKFNADMDDPALKTQVTGLKAQAKKAQVTGTPAFFINGRPFTMPHSPGDLSWEARFNLEEARASSPACE